MEQNEIMAMLIYLIPAAILGGLALFVSKRKKKN
jgi:LPXTG-motif cell wall-anchored protein